jgi:purine catabolism regulator
MNTTTIRDLLRIVLPPGSVLLTPSEGLHQQVGHAVSLRATLPAFPQLRGGELALISVEQARMLDPRLTLPVIIKRLADALVAAVAVVGEVDNASVTASEAVNLPLIHLPDGSDLRVIERDLQRWLTDAELQYERRAAQLYSELTQHVVTGDGTDALLRLAAERTGRAVALIGADGEVRLQHGARSIAAVFGALHPPLPPLQTLMGYEIYAAPIGPPSARLGYFVLADTTLDRWDELAATQTAAALMLELTKQQAVQAAEARVRGDILRTILSGTLVDPQVLQQQAAELGYDLLRPHCALMIASADRHVTIEQLHEQLRKILNRQRLHGPSLVRDNVIICFCPSDEDYTQPHALLDALASDVRIMAGMSNIAPTSARWPRAHHEAEQAFVLGQQLFGPCSIIAYSDLGVYRLLLELRDSTELRNFYHETLGALVAHDQANGGELVRTLEGYFAALGNVHQASELLHIHRNTLIYRLRRITEISGLSLKRAEDVLAIQIALRAHRIFTSERKAQ